MSYRRPHEYRLGNSTLTVGELAEFVMETFKKKVSFFSRDHLPFAIRLTSFAFAEEWSKRSTLTDLFGRSIALGGPLAFCFIDGRHEYEFVNQDFKFCDEFLLPGGLILFDDSADYTGSVSVRKLMRELTRSQAIGHRYEVIAKAPKYLIRKRP